MNDAQTKSYDLATETAKQLIGLAAGMLTFGAAFMTDLRPTHEWRGVIVGSYVALFVSIAFGTRLLYVVTLVCAEIKTANDDDVPVVTRIPGVRTSARAQYVFFATASALLAAFGFSQLG
jgi:hypothetical protein